MFIVFISTTMEPFFFKFDRNEYSILEGQPNFQPDLILNASKDVLAKILTKQMWPIFAWASGQLTYEGDKKALWFLMRFIYDSAYELLNDALTTLNRESVVNDNFRRKLEGKTKKFQLELDHGQVFSARLEGEQFGELKEGRLETPDIVIRTDMRTLEGMIFGSVNPITAMMTMKLRIKASMEDMAWLKSLF